MVFDSAIRFNNSTSDEAPSCNRLLVIKYIGTERQEASKLHPSHNQTHAPT